MYKVNSAFSARYRKSAIPAMQKILNRDRKQQQQALKSLMSPTNYASNGFYIIIIIIKMTVVRMTVVKMTVIQMTVVQMTVS